MIQPLPNGYPWGTRTANGSNPYNDVPSTNVTRYYNFTISRGQAAPDGYVTNVIVVNDQFPGPLIEANWGDWIEGLYKDWTNPVYVARILTDPRFSVNAQQYFRSRRRHSASLAWSLAVDYAMVRWRTQRWPVPHSAWSIFYVRWTIIIMSYSC